MKFPKGEIIENNGNIYEIIYHYKTDYTIDVELKLIEENMNLCNIENTDWINTSELKPDLVNQHKNSEDNWKSSSYVVVISDLGLEIAKYEKGENWEQWYSPAYDDAIEDPEYWFPLPEMPNNKR